MKLKDPELLAAYMEAKGFSQARLSRHAECSRQFIWALLNGDRTTCTKFVGDRIEEALSVLPGTLFLDSLSSDARPVVARSATARDRIPA